MTKGLDGRLTKGVGTHFASWLQEVTAVEPDAAQAHLDAGVPASSTPRGELAHKGLRAAHGKKAGHAKPITDVAYSGDLIATKDEGSLRLWRARSDFALLRVVSCRGPHVAFHPTGQFIVTGTPGMGYGSGKEGHLKAPTASGSRAPPPAAPPSS
mmetsp:Transcript_49694/g.158706  ORF Transcript_49694/g.158706 Transcript_49694/m.158706 type:complete len:155 (-) Transcript_49694:753-1217(-)